MRYTQKKSIQRKYKRVIWVSSAFMYLKFQLIYFKNLLGFNFFFSKDVKSTEWKNKREALTSACTCWEKCLSSLDTLFSRDHYLWEQTLQYQDTLSAWWTPENTLNLNAYKSQQGYCENVTFCEMPHLPGSEFLLPIRPTKMSFISPKKRRIVTSHFCVLWTLHISTKS